MDVPWYGLFSESAVLQINVHLNLNDNRMLFNVIVGYLILVSKNTVCFISLGRDGEKVNSSIQNQLSLKNIEHDIAAAC